MLRSFDVADDRHFALHSDANDPGASKTTIEIDHGPHGATATIADAHLLFNADFKRAGSDLILTGHDGKTAIVHDYFGSDERPTLLSPEGAALSPDVVNALAGPLAPGQYAQATQADINAQAVGRVATTSGDATILRNGVAVTVSAGDAILKGDVLQTGSGAAFGVTFNDGSTLNLTENTRLVVNEFVYNPNGTGNSELLNLVQGSLTFISGQIAHSGDMKIDTPVATMGIRGTVGGVTDADDGTVHVWVAQSATGVEVRNKQGVYLGNITQNGPLVVFRPAQVPLQVIAEEVQKTPQQVATELSALQALISTQAIGQRFIDQFFNPNNPNPQSTDHAHTQIELFFSPNITQASANAGGGDSGNSDSIDVKLTTHTGSGTTPLENQIETLTIPAVVLANLPPIIVGPPQETAPPNQGPVIFTPTPTVFDPDTPVLSVTLQAVNGTLSLPQTNGLTFTQGNGQTSQTMMFSGTQADINAALAELTFTPTPTPGVHQAFLEITATDGTNTATQEIPITIDQAPVLALNYVDIVEDQFNSRAYNLNTGHANWATNWIELNDGSTSASSQPSNLATTGELQVATDPAGGTAFALKLTDLDSEVGAADTVQRTVDLSTAVSATLTFEYRRDIPNGETNDKFFVLISNDGVNFTEIGQIGATGNGSFVDGSYQTFTYHIPAQYLTANTTIMFSVGDDVDNGDVVYVDNVRVTYDLSANYVEHGPGVPVVAGAFNITDVDDTTLQSATVTLTDPHLNDLLSVNGNLPNGITASYDSTNHVLTLTGQATLAEYQTALHQVEFSNSGDNPDTSDRTVMITVNDGIFDSNTSTTTIHVAQVNDPPVISDPTADTNHTAEDTPLVLKADAAVIVSDPDAGSDPLLVTLTVQHGTLTLPAVPQVLQSQIQLVDDNGADGTLSFRASIATINTLIHDYGVTYTPDPNFNGNADFTFTVNDEGHNGVGGPLSDQMTVHITVTPVNDVPTLGGVSTASVTEDVAVSSNQISTGGALTIADVDQGESNFAPQAGTAGNHGYGTFTLDAAGNWTYTASNSQQAIQQLGNGQSLTDSFTAISSDGSASQIVTVTIHGTNDVPVIGGVSTGSVTEDVAVSSNQISTSGALTIADVDQGQSNFMPQAGTAGDHGYGTFSLNAAGNWTYTASNSQQAIQQLGNGQSLTDSFTALSSDGSASQVVTVTIHGTNDVPVIGGVSTGSVTEDVAVSSNQISTSGALTIADVDQGQSNFMPQAGTAGDHGYGTFTLDAAGNWTYTASNSQQAIQQLGNGQSLTDSFTALSSDGSAIRVVTVIIHGTNDVPVITGTSSGDVTEDVNVVGNNLLTAHGLTINDTDQGQSNFTPQAGTAGNHGYGTFALDAAGNWTYTASNSQQAIQQLGDGQSLTDSFTAVSSDGTASQVVTVTIHGTNDAPIVSSGSTAVSEEGLPGGAPDTVGNPSDTTDSTSSQGNLSASDVDGNSLSWSLGTPNQTLTSGGQTVTWSHPNSSTLVGSVGATTILTVTIDNTGHYTVALNRPVDHPNTASEDVKSIDVPVNVSDGIATTTATLAVNIEDDSPRADLVQTTITPTDSKTNVMLILDLSGSMNDPSGLTGLSRLDVEKAAVNELLEQYDNRGDVMVRLVTFSTAAAAAGSVWMTVAEAKATLAGLSAGGSTNYDAGLITAISAFDDSGKLSGPGTQNVSYFLSDGAPTVGTAWPQIPGDPATSGISSSGTHNEQAVWDSFLTTNNVVSYAIGVGSGVTTAPLAPIAFDPATGTQPADTPIVVTDLNQLASTLVFSIPPVNGAFVAGVNGAIQGSFGGDGGHVQSITVDNETYTFNPATNTITASGSGVPSFSFNGTTHTLTVDTDTSAPGGELAIVMTTGAFTFHPTQNFTSENVGYTLVDNDGDTASNTLTFTASGGADHSPIVRDDHVITNITGSGAAISVPSFALLANDTDADGNPITVTATSGASSGAVSPASGSPINTLTFTDDNSNGGTFGYTGSTASPIASDVGTVTVDRSQTGSTLTGTDFGEIFIARNTATTINANGGNDVLIGGAGADQLTGGGGNDTFVFNAVTDSQPGAGHFDTITDFTHNADHLDFAAIGGLNDNQQLVSFETLAAAPATLAAHTIAIVTSGSSTVIYANSSAATASADMEVHLNGVTNVQQSDFILHH
jgi:VCBS repeat-containing protein